MKPSKKIVQGTKALTMIALCVGLSGVASAIPSLVNYQIGNIKLTGNPDSSTGLEALNDILTGYNNGNTAKSGYTPDTGSALPSAPPPTLASGVAGNVSWSSGDSVTGFNYLVVRFGTTWEAYDITGLTGDYGAPAPSDINSQGLDHAFLFDIGDPNGVPDSGTSVALLGLGLTGLSLIRRKMK